MAPNEFIRRGRRNEVERLELPSVKLAPREFQICEVIEVAE